jgi:2-C-methyl-D-erythritol 4-phosphate cytidylyltransferase
VSSGGSASVTAVIAAAGSGERLGAGGPKSFVPVAGRPMVEWSIEAFRSAGVEAIVVAIPPGHGYEPATADDGGDAPVVVVAGGERRAESVANALAKVESDLVAVHDAARPLVTPDLIRGVVSTLTGDSDAAGAIAATPVADTIKRAAGSLDSTSSSTDAPRLRLGPQQGPNRSLTVAETLDRATLWAAQTPQVFRLATLREAFAGDVEEAAATDEAMLVEACGGRVLIHPAPAENLKVTTPVDLSVAERLLSRRASPGS